jgi:hypothetical protein
MNEDERALEHGLSCSEISVLARGEPFDSLALSLSKGELAQDRPVEPRASSFDKLRMSGVRRATVAMIDEMRGSLRVAIVGLIVGLAAGPVLLDACLMSCQAVHDSASTAHACHHAEAPRTGVHLNAPPKPCGHDHHVNAATMATSDHALRVLRLAQTSVGTTVECATATPAQWFSRPMSPAQQRSTDTHRTLLTPLRV